MAGGHGGASLGARFLQSWATTGILATVDGHEYDRLLCNPTELDVGCFLSRANAADRTAAFERKLAAFRQLYPAHAVHPLSAALQTYGVEAARETLVAEVKGVFGVYGIGVDARHLSLIGDFMTQHGDYRPCSRAGMETCV